MVETICNTIMTIVSIIACTYIFVKMLDKLL